MTYEIEITSLAYGGDGIGRIDGQVCFVPTGLPGDVLEVAITRRAKGVLWGRIERVITASADRLAADAAGHVGVCGGCQWAHFAYPAQASWKQRLIHEALQRYAGVEAEVEWREDPEQRTGWRTRAELHGDGEHLGFYAHGTHAIVETPCPLLHPHLAAAVDGLRAAGWRGAVDLTVNPEGEDVLAFGRNATPESRAAVTAWDEPRTWPRAQFDFDGAPIVNGGFSQAGLLLNRLLRGAVGECVQGTGPLFDAYCGNGNLSLVYLATRKVAGMDISEPTIAAVAEIGGDYAVGDEPEMAAAIRGGAWGTIVLDPPRAGAKALVPALCATQAEELVYVSCDPVALARDLKGLAAGGWRVARVIGLDLFPNTAHMETVVRLVRGV